MKIKNLSILGVLALAFVSLNVTAQLDGPRVVVGTDSGQVGSVVPVSVPVDYVGDGTVVGIEFEVAYDNANLTADLSGCGGSLGGATVLCSESVPGVIKFLAFDQTFTPLPSGSAGSLSFDISAAPIADYVLTVQNELYGDAQEGEVPSTGSTNGLIQVVEGPQPDYSSVPTPAQGVALNVIQNDTNPSQNVLISNSGEATSTLTGTCSESSDPDGVFTISGDTAFTVLKGDPDAVVTVTCNSAGSIALHTGEMSCTHDGDGTTETSPAVYALSCNITAGPQAAYSDVLSPDPLDLVAVEEGDANPTGTITVTNSGDASTTLIGTCSYSGDAEMSLANGGFSLAQNASNVATLTCDATTEGNYNGQISCTHDAENVASPVVHNVSCAVGPPGPAVYASSPASGATIDMTPPGDDALVGSADPTSVLQITNDAAELNDRDLALSNCAFAGSAEITATPVLSPLAPGLSTFVTFTCDTTAAGAFTGTYSCSYDENGDDVIDGTATYTVNCGVRDPESDAVVTPASGTALTITVPVGGSGQTSVRFSEIMSEGADGSLDGCSLDNTTYHSIVSSTTYPQAIPSGGFLDVVVQGNNPGDPLLVSSAVLTCTYSDSDSEAAEVSWPIDIVVRAEAIPTLSVGGLLAMVLTLLGLGGIALRRRMPR